MILRRIWLIALVLIIVGGGMAAVGWILGARSDLYFDGTGVHVARAEYQAPAAYVTEEFTELDIDAWSADVELVASDHFGYELSTTGTVRLTGEYKNGVLTIRQENSHRFTILSIGIGSGRSDVKVYYPASSELERVKIETLSGGITAKGLYAQTLMLKAVSGNISIDHVDAATAEIKTTSGEITLHGSGTGFDAAYVQSVSGEITARGLVARRLTAKTTSGNVTLQGDITGKTDIDTVSGDVRVDIGWAKNPQSYYIDTVSGDIRIDGERQGKPASFGSRDDANVISAKTTSGSVTIS
jgi:hypothetical protein